MITLPVLCSKSFWWFKCITNHFETKTFDFVKAIYLVQNWFIGMQKSTFSTIINKFSKQFWKRLICTSTKSYKFWLNSRKFMNIFVHIITYESIFRTSCSDVHIILISEFWIFQFSIAFIYTNGNKQQNTDYIINI